MEIKKTSRPIMQEQKIQLVQGEFTPTQALDIIMSLINQKISFHKLESMQQWEQNHNYDQEPINNRIKQLEMEKKIAADFISSRKIKGKKLKMDGVITLKIVD